MASWSATIGLYAAIAVAAGLASFFFDWIFVFAVSVAICVVTALVFFFQGGSWSTLAHVWLAIAVFHVSYFCIGFVGFCLRLKLAENRRLNESGKEEPQR